MFFSDLFKIIQGLNLIRKQTHRRRRVVNSSKTVKVTIHVHIKPTTMDPDKIKIPRGKAPLKTYSCL